MCIAGLEPAKAPFTVFPVSDSSLPFITLQYTRIGNLCKHFLCIFGKLWEEKRVQIVCKKTGCANFVQTELAPESVQTLCKDFGLPWRVAGLWRVPFTAGGSWAASGDSKRREARQGFFFPFAGFNCFNFFTVASKSFSTGDGFASSKARNFENSSSAFVTACSWEIVPA